MFVITTLQRRTFRQAETQTILDAAALGGIQLPYSCKTGRCSTCKCKVIDGQTYALHDEIGLTEDDKAAGWILSCVRSAKTDLLLDIEDLGDTSLPIPRTAPCRIQSLNFLTRDVLCISLRLPPAVDFTFLPGQYIDVIGPNGVRRSYSLSNAPATDKILHLHVRAVPGGELSQYWFNQAKANDLIRLHGPLGTSFLRQISGLDLIFLATGTGIAPIKAMLEGLANTPVHEQPRSVTVYWGGRVEEDLYLRNLDELPGKNTPCRFVPVLSRADASWSGARGHVQDALLQASPDLAQAVVYACGSEAMINSARAILVDNGLPQARFHSDAFVCSHAL